VGVPIGQSGEFDVASEVTVKDARLNMGPRADKLR